MAFTYFFRDLQTLHLIRDLVVPSLRTSRYIHIWDAGCAHGPEPYTLAILLRENMGKMIFRNVQIHATDIDESNLFADVIKNGVYPNEQIKRIPPEILSSYFSRYDDKNNFQISEEIRKRVEFTRHNLLDLKPIHDNIGLVLCKNVLLHFQPAERVEVIKMFHGALREGGYLAMEQTQALPDEVAGLFESVVSNARIYRKIG